MRRKQCAPPEARGAGVEGKSRRVTDAQTRARYHANKRLHGGRTGVPLWYGGAQIFRVPDGRASHQAGSGRSKKQN